MTERENMILVLNGETPKWVPNFGNSAAFLYSYGCDRRLNAKTGYYYDLFGVEFYIQDGALGGPMPTNTKTQNFELTDVTEWKKVMPKVDLGKIDWKAETENMLKSASSLYGSKNDDHVYNYIVGYLWDELHYMMGFEEALYSLSAEPEATRDFLCAMADFYVDVMQEQFKYFKPDLAMVMDHVATANGLLMGPETYRSVIMPAEKKIYDALKDQGIRTEIHVDGRVDEILPDYARLGIEVIQPFQPFNDIEKAKKEYGFVAIGGWDAFGPGNKTGASEEEVRASVRTAMDAYAPTGKYAIWFSGASATSKEKMFWLQDEAQKYGRTFY